MRPELMSRRALCVLLSALPALGAGPSASRQIELSSLAVPVSSLPTGCQLEDVGSMLSRRSADTDSPWLHPPGILANPWIGTDKRVLAWIRGHVDPPLAFSPPDAPPLSAREERDLTLGLADGIVDGYAATYRDSQNRDVSVQAVRFMPGAAPYADQLTAGLGNSRETPRWFAAIEQTRTDIGSTRVVIYGKAGPCSSALLAYVRSLSK
jgi:hypothetical protein